MKFVMVARPVGFHGLNYQRKDDDNMPFKPRHPCNFPGCPSITSSRFCPEHERSVKKKYDAERESASERGYDANWHKVSRMHLNEFPLCQECEKHGKITAAILTHHIRRIVDGGDRLEWENLESLCVECHDVIHSEDRFNPRGGNRYGR